MKVKGLDGKLHSWKLINHVPLIEECENKSKYHLEARNLLTKTFSADRVLEEVYLPGSNGLMADFYIPAYKIMVEVHGEQHYKFVPHFHQNIMGFLASKKRDKDKRKWCELNSIKLIELPFDKINEWCEILKETLSE